MLVEFLYYAASIAISIFMLLTVIFWEMNFISHCIVAWVIGVMAYQMFTTKPQYVLSGNVYIALFSAPFFIGSIGILGCAQIGIHLAATIFFGVTSYVVGFWSWYVITMFQEEHARERLLRGEIPYSRKINASSIGDIAWLVFGPVVLLVSSKVEPPTRAEIIEGLDNIGSRCAEFFFGVLIVVCRMIQSELPTNEQKRKGP